MLDFDNVWVTFVIASLLVFVLLCFSLIVRKKCSGNFFCNDCRANAEDEVRSHLVQQQQQQQQRRRLRLNRDHTLQQLRLEQLQVQQQLQDLYQHQQLQCPRCHRVQLHIHRHDEVQGLDEVVNVAPPPDYIDFALPQYDELFPNLENVHKTTADLQQQQQQQLQQQQQQQHQQHQTNEQPT